MGQFYIPDFSEIMAVAQSRGANSAAPHLWNGLVGLWPFVQGGGSTLFDAASYSNHGTLTNMAPASDWGVTEKGRALNFPHTTDKVVVSAAPSLEVSRVSVAVFARSSITGVVYNVNGFIVNKVNTNPATYALFLEQAGNKMRFGVRLDGSESTLRFASADNTLDTDWHHYVGTYDGAICKLHEDGKQQAVTNATAGSIDQDNSNDLTIGSHPTVGANGWQGWMSMLSVHNRGLLAAEVQQLNVDPWVMVRWFKRAVFPAAVVAGNPWYAYQQQIA